MSIEVLYLPKNLYTSPKQISGYAPVHSVVRIEIIAIVQRPHCIHVDVGSTATGTENICA